MAVAITQTANPAGVTADGSFKTTYSALSTGTDTNDRLLAICIGRELIGALINDLTITDSIGSRNNLLLISNSFGAMGAWMYFAPVRVGTTIDVVITWSQAITNVQNHVALYVLTDAESPSIGGNNTSTDMDVTAPLTTGSTTIAVNGGMLALAVGAVDTVAKTWANLTEDLDADVGDFRFTTAFSTTAGTATRTCTGGSNGEDGVLVWAIFNESSLPPKSIVPVIPPKSVKAAPIGLLLRQAAMSELAMPPYRPR